nr:Ada metal-binding domain-containing protein [Pedobacter sp. ASV28]
MALGNSPQERSRVVASLIRKGKITLGGYRKKKTYGLLNCKMGKRMKVEHRVFFIDEEEAWHEGYRPCGNCLPTLYEAWKRRTSKGQDTSLGKKKG